MVCFRTVQGRFALPVESTLSVRTTDGLVDLPYPLPDVAGVLPGNPPLIVLTSLGAGGDRVLVVGADEIRYGLRVLEVEGLRRFDDSQVGPAPHGQQDDLICGTVGGESAEMSLVVDARVLATRL